MSNNEIGGDAHLAASTYVQQLEACAASLEPISCGPSALTVAVSKTDVLILSVPGMDNKSRERLDMLKEQFMLYVKDVILVDADVAFTILKPLA